MIEKLKQLEEQAMDEMTPEAYSDAKEFLLINNKVITPHETALYKAGYLDGLQAAIVTATENDGTYSYTIDNDGY
tara:strand:+ start:308 stop:532 length:225 start_codon:yes stop_codon:yes gene_type:complete